MSKTFIRDEPANEKLDPRWVVIPLAVMLGALAMAMLWPFERPTPPAAVAAGTVSAAPQPQPAAFEAREEGGKVAHTPADEEAPQEDNHAPTF